MSADHSDLLVERLLQVIDEGRRTATYKLALLLALIDGCALHPGATSLPTRVIAARVVELYYPQTRRYLAGDATEHQLRQITMKDSAPLRAILELRVRADAAGCRSVAEAVHRLPDAYERTLDRVEETFVRYPIPLLQVVGTQLVPFLYEPDWPELTTCTVLRRQGRDHVRFLPGVPERLVALGPLLRPLIELHWTRDVARWSGVATEDERLRAHLFGAERATFPVALRRGLLDLQHGACFYCHRRISHGAQVDHFLPWSRWPNDAVENLVLADACNGAKSDHLAAAAHLARWRLRLEHDAALLAEVAAEARWETSGDRSLALVRSTYTHLPTGTPLWLQAKEFEVSDGRLAPFLR